MNDTYDPFPPPPAPARSPFASKWYWLLGLFSVSLLAFLVWLIPLEIEQWRLATALQQRQQGNKEAAYKILDESLARKERWAVLLLRAQWRVDDKQYEQALADIDRCWELSPGSPELRMRRSMVLQHLERHAEAVEELTEVVKFTTADTPQARAEALNALAYARSVGNIDPATGLREIEEAIKIHPDEAALLDTRGFLLYRLGELTDAEKDITTALALAEAELKEREAASSSSARRSRSKAATQAALEMLRRNVAVMAYHRALVREKLGAEADAKADYERVKELGFTPGKELF